MHLAASNEPLTLKPYQSEIICMSHKVIYAANNNLEGFIECHNCDAVIVAGDFNVDFDRDGQNSKLLEDYIMDLKLHVRDLDFHDQVCHTYE